MNRTQTRSAFDIPVRLVLIESDMDAVEGDLKDGLDGLRAEIKNLSRVLIGILISLATASVLLAINVVIQR